MIRKIICQFKGHLLEQESIVKTIGQNNWCRKCLRCGRYFLHSDVGGVTIDAESAMAFKAKFEKEMAWIDDLFKEGGADMSNEEQILICAVRYALGRQSYITGVVADYVAHKRKTLSQECKNIIIRDIQEERDFYHRQGQTLGMECDERTWLRLEKLLKNGEEHE